MRHEIACASRHVSMASYWSTQASDWSPNFMLAVTNETVIKWRLSFFDLGFNGCTFQLFFLIKHPIYTHVTSVNVSDIETWHFYEVRKLLLRTEKWSNLWSMLTLKQNFTQSHEQVGKIWCEKIWQLSWHFWKLSLSLRNLSRLFANKLSAAFWKTHHIPIRPKKEKWLAL